MVRKIRNYKWLQQTGTYGIQKVGARYDWVEASDSFGNMQTIYVRSYKQNGYKQKKKRKNTSEILDLGWSSNMVDITKEKLCQVVDVTSAERRVKLNETEKINKINMKICENGVKVTVVLIITGLPGTIR